MEVKETNTNTKEVEKKHTHKTNPSEIVTLKRFLQASFSRCNNLRYLRALCSYSSSCTWPISGKSSLKMSLN